ncbi:NTP transferase domain-containing protein [Desulfonatronovibrio hydrogenovorans]|uniref:phosphocholine cytidylyltransferase family protein n=1 Tax=Desulfonatronovibrio hydrogenovorans TaxID=53245 RepID=UPI000A5FC2DD|nr:phosphocholine cytidylyltransferase family protein [Desulfonatronovibrio hydrogenovorans]
MMKAVILAAGRGSRLLTLTDDRPKCLVELKGKPLLHWQLEALREAGIHDILVVRGYCKDQITGDFETTENPRWNETNMVATLMAARDWLLHQTCIVSYADIVYPCEAIHRLMQDGSSLSILYDINWLDLWQQRFEDPLSDAESFRLDEQGSLVDIGRKQVSIEEIQGQYMGLLKFTPKAARWVFDLLDKSQELVDRLDMTSLLQLLMDQGKSIQAVPWDGPWCEVDNEIDLQVAKEISRIW